MEPTHGADDLVDWSTVRVGNRATCVATAMRYLGAEREKDAELLADFMMAHLDSLAAASGLLMRRTDFPDSARIMEELGARMREHAGEMFNIAQHALGDMFWRTLAVATGRGPAT